MERIAEDQVNRLARLVWDRIPDPASLQGEARRTATANGATTDVAAAAWNLLVAFAEIWHDHPEFSADAARETFEFD
ncbi:hypothetical protein ACIP5U_38045 [Streptomyces sp. NPDC088788]|uniref:hypothetical protein n=1 Tax=Streptomyces sp. NPDC088788 TaxID=3365898 RepID=UPI0037FBA39F